MPTDDQRDIPFGAPLGDAPELPRLDASSVIRRSRRRRRVQQVAVGSVATLAVFGIVGGIGLGFRSFGFTVAASSSAGSATDGAATPEYSGTSGGSKSLPDVGGSVTKPRFDCGTALPTLSSAPSSAALIVDLRITWAPAAATAATGRLTLTSTTDVPAALGADDPIVVVAREGRVTSSFAVDAEASPQSSSLRANDARIITGRLSASTCGDTPGPAASATDDFLVVIPVVVDGETRWLTTVPDKVSIR